MKEAVFVTSSEEMNFMQKRLGYNDRHFNFIEFPYIHLWENNASKHSYVVSCNISVITYEDYIEREGLSINNKNKIGMQELILDVLNKTYDNPILRRTTIPLFMSNPGMGKSTIIRNFAESKGVGFKKITLSQRMPNEVVGGLMPDKDTKKWEVYDTHELSDLKDGDILFFDEVFNGTLKQTLDAVLNLLQDRALPSGKKLADIMIVAASNPQGLINLTPQIKERFVRYDLIFNSEEYKDLLENRYGMPRSISSNLCSLINREKFDSAEWNFKTPRSIETAINQIGCDLKSPYDDILIPFLSQETDEFKVDMPEHGIKKGDKVPYINLLKIIIKSLNKSKLNNKKTNDTKNNKSKSRATTNILN